MVEIDLVKKRCTICGVQQDITEFRFRSRKTGKRHSECKTCATIRARRSYHQNSARSRASARRSYRRRQSSNPLQFARWQREQQLYIKFGITVEQYEAIAAAQDNQCAICGQPERVRRQNGLLRLSVDHDHKTNRIRALLCRHCNQAIGKMQDDPQRLRKAAAYLEYHRGERNSY